MHCFGIPLRKYQGTCQGCGKSITLHLLPGLDGEEVRCPFCGQEMMKVRGEEE